MMKKKFFGNIPVRKRFGQNFLTNEKILDQIVEAANIFPDDFILEIGPGHGALTKRLIEKSEKVVAVEIDRDLSAKLTEKFADKKGFSLLNQDILELDLNLNELDNYPLKKRKALGNIPYYITTPIIMKFINEDSLKKNGITNTNHFFSEVIIMLQKEVGERILAKPGTKEYGALSVITQYACEIEPLLFVSRENFYPKPKVDSMVISLKIKTEDHLNIKNPDIFWRLVHSVFISRRKTLKNSLKMGNFTDLQISSVEKEIDSGIRGETMDLETFALLSNLLDSAS